MCTVDFTKAEENEMTVDYSNQPVKRLEPNGQVKQQQPPKKAREVEIFTQIGRHVLAILYLVAELRLGYKPEKLKVKNDSHT